MTCSDIRNTRPPARHRGGSPDGELAKIRPSGTNYEYFVATVPATLSATRHDCVPAPRCARGLLALCTSTPGARMIIAGFEAGRKSRLRMRKQFRQDWWSHGRHWIPCSRKVLFIVPNVTRLDVWSLDKSHILNIAHEQQVEDT